MVKLSVCIPVYNFDVRELVYGLKKQITEQNLPAEIILIDDFSDQYFLSLNSEIQNITNVFVPLDENVGRSKIRNLFLEYAQGEYLLFLDCDVKMTSDYFLEKYLEKIKQNPGLNLFYGSFRILEQFSHTLRNQYSAEREIFFGDSSADFSVFKTVNFVIKTEVFSKFRFNENLEQYGYEDYLFSKLLEENKVEFLAFQNPVFHYDDTSNSVFLDKLKLAAKSLSILAKDKNNIKYLKSVKLYKTATILEKLFLKPTFLFIFSIFEKKIESNLFSKKPSIKNLDLYKLAFFLRAK